MDQYQRLYLRKADSTELKAAGADFDELPQTSKREADWELQVRYFSNRAHDHCIFIGNCVKVSFNGQSCLVKAAKRWLYERSFGAGGLRCVRVTGSHRKNKISMRDIVHKDICVILFCCSRGCAPIGHAPCGSTAYPETSALTDQIGVFECYRASLREESTRSMTPSVDFQMNQSDPACDC